MDNTLLLAEFGTSLWYDFNVCHHIDTTQTHVITAINSLALILSDVNATIAKKDKPITSRKLDATHWRNKHGS